MHPPEEPEEPEEPGKDPEREAGRAQPSPVFFTTYWTQVRQAANPGPQRTEALGYLVTQYSPALKQYLRTRFQFDFHTAEDVVQSFVLEKLLKGDLLAKASQESGKFRTFLLTSIHNWAVDYIRRTNAQKRKPDGGISPLPDDDGLDGAVGEEDARTFDNLFVRHVLATAVHRLHDHCRDQENEEAWTVFYHRVLAPVLEIADTKPYGDIIPELGLPDNKKARNLLGTAKRIFARELRGVVGEYTSSSAEAAEELAELRKLLD